ncbi:MAG: hypothetical protein IJ036_05525 [Lachnospiraceae bacterium]|nr:hypothetical protein [Lachnospiraceae bacterium]
MNAMALGMGIGMVVYYLVVVGIGIASYITVSMALYTLAKERRISNAGLAWVPVGNMWILGAIADYHDELKGEKRKWRTLLLVLSLISIAGIVVVYIIAIVFVMIATFSGMTEGATAMGAGAIILVIFLVILFILLMLAATANQFCCIICYNKIYEALAPKKSIKYLLLSILVPVANGVCLLKCRNSMVGVPGPAYSQNGWAPVSKVAPETVPESESAEEVKAEE